MSKISQEEKDLILLSLCTYDKRNPDSSIFEEEDRAQMWAKKETGETCYCDNCFRGLTRLGELVMKLVETK